MVLKFLTQMVIMRTKVSVNPNFLMETVLRTLGWSVKDINTKTNLRKLTATRATDVGERKALVAQSFEATFTGKPVCDF